MLEGNIMSLQLSGQVFLKHDEAANAYYLFCLDNGRHYRLNETSFEIASMIQQGRNRNEILTWFGENYDIDTNVCKRDIDEFIEFLSENNLLDKG